jgi:hypothetical protein
MVGFYLKYIKMQTIEGGEIAENVFGKSVHSKHSTPFDEN